MTKICDFKLSMDRQDASIVWLGLNAYVRGLEDELEAAAKAGLLTDERNDKTRGYIRAAIAMQQDVSAQIDAVDDRLRGARA